MAQAGSSASMLHARARTISWNHPALPPESLLAPVSLLGLDTWCWLTAEPAHLALWYPSTAMRLLKRFQGRSAEHQPNHGCTGASMSKPRRTRQQTLQGPGRKPPLRSQGQGAQPQRTAPTHSNERLFMSDFFWRAMLAVFLLSMRSPPAVSLPHSWSWTAWPYNLLLC